MTKESPFLGDKPSIVDVNGNAVVVHFLADAQGTFFLQYDPRESLTDLEQDIYFMGEPGVGSEQDVLRLEQIIKKHHLEKLAIEIMHEPNYINYPDVKKLFYLGDRLAEEYFLRQGCTRQQMLEERGKIAQKVYYLRSPHVIKEIQKHFPNVKITIVSQAGQYMKGTFESLLDEDGVKNVGVIVAPGYMSTRYTKMEPELYRIIKANNPSIVTSLIDDNESRVNPARKAGVKAKLYTPYDGDKDGEQLLDESSKLIIESIDEAKQKH